MAVKGCAAGRRAVWSRNRDSFTWIVCSAVLLCWRRGCCAHTLTHRLIVNETKCHGRSLSASRQRVRPPESDAQLQVCQRGKACKGRQHVGHVQRLTLAKTDVCIPVAAGPETHVEQQAVFGMAAEVALPASDHGGGVADKRGESRGLEPIVRPSDRSLLRIHREVRDGGAALERPRWDTAQHPSIRSVRSPYQLEEHSAPRRARRHAIRQ